VTRHVLDIDDLTPDELATVLDLSERETWPHPLDGKGVALIFEKPSARTRNATEMAVVQLGGYPLTMRGDEVGFDVRESVEDIARTMSCYHAAIAARVFRHEVVERLARASSIPVVNLLSDRSHPMQALADLLTMRQEFGPLEGRTLAYVGDANNVCRSLLLGATMLGMKTRVASPVGYGLGAVDVDRLRVVGSEPALTTRPIEAVGGADVVYTDVWVSMGQEDERDTRLRQFEGFGVDDALMTHAANNAIFLHCLPAKRGYEVSDDVIDGPQSRVWQQAANRMHTARGLLLWLFAHERDEADPMSRRPT
jgi:ornithine carbamoyltransferase